MLNDHGPRQSTRTGGFTAAHTNPNGGMPSNENPTTHAMSAGEPLAAGRPRHLPTALLSTLHREGSQGSDPAFGQRLQSLLDRLEIGVFRMTREGRLVAGSPVFRRLLAIDADEEIERFNLYDFFVRPERRAERMADSAAGEIEAKEVQLRRADGRVIWVEVTETVDDSGDEVVVEGVLEEITEHKRAEEAMWLGEAYFRALVEQMDDMIHVLGSDGRIRYVSPSVQRVLGYRADELAGMPLLDLVEPTVREAAQAQLAEVTSTPRASRSVELQLQRQDGGWRRFETKLQNLRHDPVVNGIVATSREVPAGDRVGTTESGDAARMRLALEVSQTGVWELNARTGRLRGSESASALLGMPAQRYRGTYGEILKCVHPADIDRVTQSIGRAVDERHDFELEFRVVRPDGATRWLCVKGRVLGSGEAARVVGTVVDGTERKIAQDKLLHDAFHDSLTGLANRALFMDRLTHTVAVAERHTGFHFGVLIVDLDHFKQINDSLGHLVGDQLLIAAARRLERCLRPGDTVARWGGDEFTVLLNDLSDARDATRVAERILAEFRTSFRVTSQELFTSASIGIAYSATGFGRPDDMLRNADTALYRAKMRGRNRYEAFDQEMHRRAMALNQMERELRQAVERGELRVHYQPIIALDTGTIRGFEALLRWQHAQRGRLAPGEFLRVAEDAGLMLELDRWVLGEACRQVTRWSARYPEAPLKISVNLSSKDFAHPELVDRVRSILEETGCAGGSLRLELSEAVFDENRDAAAAILRQLKELDILLQVDNFGKGTSGVTSLHEYPIDSFKIDRSLVGRLDKDPQAPGIVRALVELAHNLGMTVTAEGTETPEQLRLLRELGCDYAQGFFFAEPAESAAAEALLTGAPSW
jgi:diguanylate cyclase (GGDEF)-like protein/PAS domain S-box-containing protein